ncbi:MAG TPA: S8 family serine peptidase [Anaerohalosphaeraceae bacterium]|nr:S8 family serine peptidase [Anaerohalosphaeraceae bacterium]
MNKGKCLWVVRLGLFFSVCRVAYPLAESADPNGINVKVLHQMGYTGKGVRVGVLSQMHCRTTHEAFFDKDLQGNPFGNSHAYWYDPTSDTVQPYEPYWHDTSLAGIVASRGGKNFPQHRGMAPDAEIYSAKVTRCVSETDPNRTTNFQWFQKSLDYFRSSQCRIVVTGIQLGADYDQLFPFTLLYDYYTYTHGIFFANAAGNDNGSVTIFGTAFNGVTTAGLITTEPDVYRRIGSASNPGPTLDGRRKPEIAAPAQKLTVPTDGSDTAWRSEGTERGQTSWAAPHTAGAAAVLLEYADTTSEPDDGRSVVLKAVLVNSAFPNIQDKTGLETTGQLWHPHRGYGRLDAARAFSILSSPKLSVGQETSQPRGWTFQSLSPGQTHTYTLPSIPIGSRLVLTVTWKRRVRWQDKPPRNNLIDNGELTGYLANLDLVIEDSAGRIVFSDTGTFDNLKKADLLIAQTGLYRIRIRNQSSTESAEYGLAYEILEPLTADLNLDAVVDKADLELLLQSWLQNPCGVPFDGCERLDLLADNFIDLGDLKILAGLWKTRDPRYCILP